MVEPKKQLRFQENPKKRQLVNLSKIEAND